MHYSEHNEAPYRNIYILKNIIDSPLCECGETEDTSHHFVNCPDYTRMRNELYHYCIGNIIVWILETQVCLYTSLNMCRIILKWLNGLNIATIRNNINVSLHLSTILYTIVSKCSSFLHLSTSKSQLFLIVSLWWL